MKETLTILTFIFIVSSCNYRLAEKKEKYVDESIVGIYNKGFKDMGTNLTLSSNGSFINQKYWYSDYVQKGEPSGLFTNTIGKYTIDSNSVSLYPDYFVKKEIFRDTTKIVDSAKYYNSDSTTISTVFTVIKWNSNIYLLSEQQNFQFGYRTDNDFVRFADNYNSGSEPRWNESYFSQRNRKDRFEKIELNQIPTEWRSYFIDSPIHIVVSKIKQDFFYDSLFMNYINRFELIGGAKDKVREGMTFYGNDGCCILKIMEVFDSTSFGIIELCSKQQNGCEIGDTLTTWNKKDNGKYVP